MSFHPAAWLAWCAATMILIVAVANPVVSVMAVGALVAVAAACRPSSSDARATWMALRVGAVMIVVRVVLFGLTGHEGATTIVTLPTFGVPAWLGGFTIGGRITAEVVGQQVVEGVRLAAVLTCFGVLFSIVDVHRLLRMVPRAFFEAGLVLAIAITFVPVMLRTATQIREAQRMRGYAARGFRGARALVTPVLSDALERSLELAASMESRGFGRGAGQADARARRRSFWGVLGVVAGGAMALLGRPLPGILVVLASWVVAAMGFRQLRANAPRTSLRPHPVGGWDLALIAGSIGVAVASLAARALLPSAHWYAYPILRPPDFDVRIVVLSTAVACPMFLLLLRAARLARASDHAQAPGLEVVAR